MPDAPAETDATNYSNAYAVLPPVSDVLSMAKEVGTFDHQILVDLIRVEIDSVRALIDKGHQFERSEVVQHCLDALHRYIETKLSPAINGTGIVLHTNLGRAPVSVPAARAMASAAGSYVPLEIVPETNERGGRMTEISRLMQALTGAESTLVVNNNAAAVLLTLAALCAGGEVLVARGDSVEIGGGFRIPDVLEQSGATLVDVGTTNRTYARDFTKAITERSTALLKVHASNFHMNGFVANASTAELSKVASMSGLPLIEDLGSGALIDTAQFGLTHEPTVGEKIGDGATLVTFSGDKLLGGPQAGFIAGKRDVVERIGRHPLARALRADKATLAGIGETLRHYLRGESATVVPVWQMISASQQLLRQRAAAIVNELPTNRALVADSTSSIGGGSLPGQTQPSIAIQLDAAGAADELARRLRVGVPAVFPIIRDGQVLIDLRTVLAPQDAELAKAIARALTGE